MYRIYLLLVSLLLTFTVNSQSTNTRQIRFFPIVTSSDTTASITNDGRMWYDTSTDEFRVNINGVNYSLLSSFSSPLTGSLTINRVPFASGPNTLEDDADMTFTGGNLFTATNATVTTSLKNSALTAGRVHFSGTAGLFTDDADLTFTGGNTLNSTIGVIGESLLSGGDLTLGNGTATGNLTIQADGTGSNTQLEIKAGGASDVDIYSGSNTRFFDNDDGSGLRTIFISPYITSSGESEISNSRNTAVTKETFTLRSGNGVSNASTTISSGDDIKILSGNGTTTNGDGGDIILATGVGSGSGLAGDIEINSSKSINATTSGNGSFTLTTTGTGDVTVTSNDEITLNATTTLNLNATTNLTLETTNSGSSTLKLNSGANEQMGTATLSLGTVTVNNSKVTANTFIFISRVSGGVAGTILTYTITPGTSFTINSSGGLDTGVVIWLLVEPN